MIEVQILIPLLSNEGARFAPAVHEQFEARAVALFGGFTRFPGAAVGGWANVDGRIFHDRTRVYGLGLQSIAQGHLVGEIARFVRVTYRQEAVFIRYLGVNEILA